VAKYWVPVATVGTGNWSDTAHWSDSDGGAGGASLPTSGDNVIFNTNSSPASYTVTVDVAANCADMIWANPASGSPTLAGSSALNIYGSLTRVAGMGWTYSGTRTHLATSGTKTITSAGTTDLGPITFNGSGGTFQLSDNWTTSANITLTAGTFAPNTYAVILTGTAQTITGSFTFATLTRTGTATFTDSLTLNANQTVTGTLNLTGNSSSNRLMVKSNTLGTARTINCTGATVNITDADLQDIVISGSPTVGTNTRSGDCGGNTGWTFTTPADKFWVPGATGGTGSWSDATNHWALSDGGAAGANNYPLPQDTAKIVASSVTAASKTITMDEPRYGSIDFTGVLNTPTVTLGFAGTYMWDIYGSLNLSGINTASIGSSGYAVEFCGRGSYNLYTGGVTMPQLNINAPLGTCTVQDAFVSSSPINLLIGTLTFNNINVSASRFLSNYTTTRALNLGTGTFTLTNNNIAIWNSTVSLSLNATGSTVVISNSLTDTNTITTGGKTFNNLTIQGAGAYATTISDSNTFNTINIDASAAAKTLKITNGTTQTVANFTRDAGTNVVTITNTSSTTAGILAKSGGGTISLDYVALTYNTGSPANTWHCGANSTIGAGVTGWSKEFVQMTAEAIGITESGVMAPMAWVLKVGAEAIGITDSFIKRALSVRYTPNVVGIADSLMRRALSNRLIAETVGIADSAIKRALSVRLFADDIGITDAENTRFALLKSCNEAIGVTEDAIRRSWLTKITAEGIGIADSFIKRAWSIRLTPDSIGLVDSFFKRAFSIRPESETVGVTDSGTRRAWSVRMLAENLGISDSIIKRAYSNRLVSEAIGLTDSIIKRMWSVKPTAEQITLSDMSIRRAWAVRMAAEVIAITDSLVRRMISSRLIAETVGVIDSMLSLRWLMKISNEVIAITDSMRGILFQVLRTAVKKARMKVSRLPFTRIDKEGFL